MSISTNTDVFCDTCGNWITGYTGKKPQAKIAREYAKRHGWEIRRSGDFCPRCKEVCDNG